MKQFLLILMLVMLQFSQLEAKVKIIFDTDFGGDADDLGALAMLHGFIDNHECDLLAIMLWTNEEFAVPAIDALRL